jgi:RsiW-degrading membrane proteinase PrsW (M82 family)
MKLTIVINDGSLAGREFNLETGHLSIGRSATCSIRFDPLLEKIASSQHAFIESRPDGFYITDNNSTNGTYVNGGRISQSRVVTGDQIQFGTNGITAGVIVVDDYATLRGTQEAAAPENDEAAIYSAATSFNAPQVEELTVAYAGNPAQGLRESVGSMGLGRLEARPAESKTGKYIGVGLTLLAVAFLALMVTGIVLLDLGLVNAVIASVVAFIPALIYLFPLIWLDRYDPEPFWLLALAFAWGALLALFISYIANTIVFIGAAGVLGNPQAGIRFGVVFAAPFFEELTKGAGLLMIILVFRRHFDGILDGIIFAGVIALGFATVENVLYYGRAFDAGGVWELVARFWQRGVLSPFAHVTFTAMTGIGFGIARETHYVFLRFLLPLLGLGAAMFLHLIWNFMALALGDEFIWGYLIIEIPIFCILAIFAGWIMWRQNRVLKEMLAIDVARGLIPQEDFEKATSAFRSSWWKLTSMFGGKYRATSRYIQAIGKLGLSYWHIQRATAAQGDTASFQQNPILRAELIKWRDAVRE